MAERADITVDWGLSPRLIEVALPSVALSNQDLHDTLNSNTLQPGQSDDSLDNMDDDQIIDSAGKENLGAGVEVGITSTLLDGQVAFGRTAPRTGAETITTGGSATQLIASAATLQTDICQRGDWVINWTDRSVTEILEVQSETQARCRALSGGVTNLFNVNDVITVWEVAEAELSGGNTVAIDTVPAAINPLFTTFGRFATKSSASSATATIAQLEITNLQFLIESLRSEASVFGNIWYWDPVSGNDANNGESNDSAFLTFAAAQAAATANNSDGIFIVHDSGAALTITERLSITKNGIILRGPGSSVLLQPADDAGPTIHINADNVSLSGFKAVTTGATPQAVIHCTGGNGLSIQDIWINSSTEAGIHTENGDDLIIKNCTIESCADEGIHLLNMVNARIFDNRIQRNTGNGIQLDETTTTRDCWISNNVLHHNSNAILINAGVSMTIISKSNMIGPPKGKNFADLIVDNGSATHNEWGEWWDAIFETWQRQGLDPNAPMTTNDDNSVSFGGIVIGAVNGPTSTIQTRVP